MEDGDRPWRPSWKQLAAIPDSVTKQAVLRALDIKVPPEGRAARFQDKGLYMEATGDDVFVVMDAGKATDGAVDGPCRANSAAGYVGGSAVLKAIRWPPGTPTGEAVRHWLRQHGWVPATEKRKAEPQENTKTVI